MTARSVRKESAQVVVRLQGGAGCYVLVLERQGDSPIHPVCVLVLIIRRTGPCLRPACSGQAMPTDHTRFYDSSQETDGSFHVPRPKVRLEALFKAILVVAGAVVKANSVFKLRAEHTNTGKWYECCWLSYRHQPFEQVGHLVGHVAFGLRVTRNDCALVTSVHLIRSDRHLCLLPGHWSAGLRPAWFQRTRSLSWSGEKTCVWRRNQL